MTDTRTPEQRHRIMAAVRNAGTSPELQLRRALHAAGVRGWRCNYERAQGKPDVAWPGLRVAVFVDGAFWHGHPSRYKVGRSGAYWDDKIAGNIKRDREVVRGLEAGGWVVVRVWDFEIRRDLSGVVTRVLAALAGRAAGTARWHRTLRVASPGRAN